MSRDAQYLFQQEIWQDMSLHWPRKERNVRITRFRIVAIIIKNRRIIVIIENSRLSHR